MMNQISLCCASCGIAGIDDIELKECADCDIVRYCSDECRKEHWPKHKRDCEKRAAELRDELLFKEPESSHLGDCPICMLPMPTDPKKCSLRLCCSKEICSGCYVANLMRDRDLSLESICPFCREPTAITDEVGHRYTMNRLEANDPVAIRREGIKHLEKVEYTRASEYFAKAAELGDADAHYNMGNLYHFGHGVEKDGVKCIHHLEEAAIGGHPQARHNLGACEWKDGKYDRAAKHYVISAAQGIDKSTKALMEMFKDGFVSKEDLAGALRAHQAAVDETKSVQREAADKLKKMILAGGRDAR